jgi:hypothetical protein
MKLPRRIEWRAGVVIFGSAVVILCGFTVASRVRVDQVIEVEARMVGDQERCRLRFQLPGERLDVLPDVREIRFRDSRNLLCNGRVTDIQGELGGERGNIAIVMSIDASASAHLAQMRSETCAVNVELIGKRDVSLLSMALAGLKQRR